MKIGILGTGGVGRTLAAKLNADEHEVMIGTRNIADTMAKSKPDGMGNPPFKEWQEQNSKVKLGTFADAAKFGETIILATYGDVTTNAIDLAGNENFSGKLVVNTTNPLDFSKGVITQNEKIGISTPVFVREIAKRVDRVRKSRTRDLHGGNRETRIARHRPTNHLQAM